MRPHAHAPQLAKISELARLAGVPAPTIKHYMREGLLPPPAHRSSRNMAWYDLALAERVRVIKDLQQQHFLPLRVIAEILEPAPSAAIRGDLNQTVRRQLGSLEPAVRDGHGDGRTERRSPPAGLRSRSEVLATMQVTDEDLEVLSGMGLLEATTEGPGEPEYSGADLDIVEVIHEAREARLGGLFGLDVLATYLDVVRAIARVELDMFRDRVLTDSSLTERSRAEIARKAVALGARLVVAMRNKLIISELRGLADRAATIPPPPPPAPAPARSRARRKPH
jgi:DNA-binding transcriptional MerR regulator